MCYVCVVRLSLCVFLIQALVGKKVESGREHFR